MSIVKKSLPEKLLVETQDLKLKMYSNPDFECHGGSDEENEEHFYLKETASFCLHTHADRFHPLVS